MTFREKAFALRAEGYNCAQAVLGCCCERFGMDQHTAYHVAAFFGGGMRRAEVCGAVSGTLMALGLAYGDENNRKSTKSLEFLRAYQETYGSLICRELVGIDGRKKKEQCPLLIGFCADYLEKEFETNE